MNNADIYEYLNSRDTKNYLKEIGYEFSLLEAMWIIWRCMKLNVEQRHKAWEELIASFPDCSLKQRSHVDAQESVHAYLRAVMDAENEVISGVCSNEEGAIYMHKYWRDSGYEGECIFASYDECKSAIVASFAEDIELDCDCGPIVLKKKWLDGSNDEAYVILDSSLSPIGLGVGRCCARFKAYREHENDYDGFWFHIPTPFQKGDLVVNATDGKAGPCGGIFKGPAEPFVLWSTAYESAKAWRPGALERKLEYGDSSDMTAYGYWLRPDGSFFWECMHDYLDLEYFRDEPKGLQRILLALSLEMKGELEPDLYTDAVRLFIAESVAGEAADRMNLYIDSALEPLGLSRGKLDEMWGPYYGLPENVLLI